MIKKLDMSYANKCKEIVFSQKKISGTIALDSNKLDYIVDKFLSGIENYFTLGYFEDQKLISFIFFSFQNYAVFDNKVEKFWVISGLYSTIKRPMFSFNNKEIGELVAYSFNLAENNNYNILYYSISKHVSKVFEKKFMENTFMPVNRYEKEVVLEIPKNTLPENLVFRRLLGNQPKPHDTIIKKRTLMQPYRKISL